ncbi:hypothetical protein CANINC_002353 [Pichia inconspicua]|uniref:E3 ubiquitin-protein ligase PEP5 n=1 Tax=Pichia inconspicua TaxID=52247 RepID=A0A4T0X1S9_9ASCO|nr:hypothetical protein CANINC_002353 [[Candida] inconspicua]
MSIQGWRQFPFFEGTFIKDPYLETPNALYSDPSLSAICATKDNIAIAVSQTWIKIINQEIEELFSFQCYEDGWTITNIKYFPSFLVTFAERQGHPSYMKLWDLKKVKEKLKIGKFNHNSSFVSSCQITQGSNNFPLTCWDISEDRSMFVFGFSNGSIVLVRGDLVHDRGSRQRVIYESNDPVSFVSFKDEYTLFVTTFSKTFTLSTSGKNNRSIERLLDEEGADIGCASRFQGSLLVARTNCLQMYNSKGKTTALNLDIPKKRCFVYNDRYIACISQNTSDIAESNVFSNHKLILLDTKHQFIVFNQSIPSSLLEFFKCWNDLYAVLLDGSLLKLHEKSVKECVDILVKNEQFHTAVKIATENITDFTTTDIMKLRNQYGKYLYSKGEFQDAMDEFVECIPLDKTSDVIVMFRESSKIPYLIKYLEKMVVLKVSKVNHVNLLLTCYCKLKQFEKFSKFIDDIRVDDDYDIVDSHLMFDFEDIIQLCIDNEYYDLALQVAKKFNLSSTVVSIQLNYINDPLLTLKYIRSLQVDDLLRVLVDNVSDLLNVLPNEITQLLIDVFTGKYQLTDVDKENDSEVVSIVSYPLFTSYKQFASFMNRSEDEQIEEAPTYQPPRPQIIFSSFFNHNYEFVIFLEACIESYDKFGGNTKDKNDISNTLYELYLTLSQEDLENSKDWEKKALTLLRTRQEWTEEDKAVLLLISNTYNFEEGELTIKDLTKEQSNSLEGYFMDLFRFAIFAGDLERSYEIVLEHGAEEPELYRLALTTYTSKDSYLSELGDEKIHKILELIEKQKSLLPLEVIDCMTSGGANVKLGLVKDYILRSIEKQKKEIENNEKLMVAYEAKLKDLTDQIQDIMKKPKFVDSTKCSVCSKQLEFPIVYFKCGHQMHELCLADHTSILGLADDNNSVCPICASDQDALLMLKKQQDEMATRQDLFKANLKSSTEKFKTTFAFLGRGGLEPAKVVINENSTMN